MKVWISTPVECLGIVLQTFAENVDELVSSSEQICSPVELLCYGNR